MRMYPTKEREKAPRQQAVQKELLAKLTGRSALTIEKAPTALRPVAEKGAWVLL